MLWKFIYLLCCINVILVKCQQEGGNSDIRCDPKSRYPNIDGTCHNLKKPTYGMTGSMYRRIVAPHYENNDGRTPRLTGASGKPLPSPRKVSTEIHTDDDHPANQSTIMVMQWGQFLSHDMSKTPDDSSPELKCCNKDQIGDGDQHPDVMNGGPCFPIIVPTNDRYFNNSRCMEFVRSKVHKDSKNIREQYNELSSWIDASQIYGVSKTLAESLRSFTGGKLRVNIVNGQEFLPRQESETECFMGGDGDYCFLAGDVRSNVYPGLSALHTIFVRYHNQLCDRLKVIHQDWDDETLYQETRRIIIAIVQRISYDHYLPQIIGPLAVKYELVSGSYKYNDTIDPTLVNVFSTAAYRFGHSLITNDLNIDGQNVSTGALLKRTKYVLGSLNGVVKGLVSERCQQADMYYTKGMTDHLFESPINSGNGFDIVSLNIQRGRDHGLPPYNVWRELFGLQRQTFDNLGAASEKYRKIFESVDDIDLYSGGINEPNAEGAIVGELYAKILAQQFRDLKFGDRFWFENKNDVTSFSKEQINEILKITLSKIICDTVPGFSKIQLDVFMPVGPDNPVMACSSFDDINLKKF